MKYIVKIYTGTFEDHKLAFESSMKKMPKTIQWVTAPGFATIERRKKKVKK